MGVSLFIKEPHSKKIVSWHQDLTYWDLDNSEETTCWVALTPVSEANGCMKFIPGSQKQRILPHTDTFAEDNMLSRGQEIAVKVDEDDAVNVELAPGQASLHHGHLFHASGPNVSGIPRVAVAIRYIKTSMKQSSGERPSSSLPAARTNSAISTRRDRHRDVLPTRSSNIATRTCAQSARCFSRASMKTRAKGTDEARGL